MAKKCDQCTWVYINGIFCHETGCPNQHKDWDEEESTWVYAPDEDSDYIEDEDDLEDQ